MNQFLYESPHSWIWLPVATIISKGKLRVLMALSVIVCVQCGQQAARCKISPSLINVLFPHRMSFRDFSTWFKRVEICNLATDNTGHWRI